MGRFSFLNTLLIFKIDVKCENESTNVNPMNFILYILDLMEKESRLFWSKKMSIFPLTWKLISYPQITITRVSYSLWKMSGRFLTYVWLCICMYAAAAAAKLLQSCPTLCDPIDGSPPGPSLPGILQARTLEWVAISFSNAWKWKVKVKSLSRVSSRPHGLQPTPVLFPGKFCGRRSLVGCSPWGCKELGTTERLHFHFQ